jgi:hypothetical protein
LPLAAFRIPVIRKRNVGADKHIVFDAQSIPELHTVLDGDSVTNDHIVLDEAMRADIDIRTDLRAG